MFGQIGVLTIVYITGLWRKYVESTFDASVCVGINDTSTTFEILDSTVNQRNDIFDGAISSKITRSHQNK